MMNLFLSSILSEHIFAIITLPQVRSNCSSGRGMLIIVSDWQFSDSIKAALELSEISCASLCSIVKHSLFTIIEFTYALVKYLRLYSVQEDLAHFYSKKRGTFRAVLWSFITYWEDCWLFMKSGPEHQKTCLIECIKGILQRSNFNGKKRIEIEISIARIEIKLKFG